MSATRRTTQPLLLTRAQAAASLGVSLRHFQRHIQPALACVYSGQLRLYPAVELQRWVDEQTSHHQPAS